MTPERLLRLKSVLNHRQPDLTVITDFVNKERNLSAILRNCDAVGIGRVHSVMSKPMFRAFRKTAAGSHKWVETAPYSDISAAIGTVKGQGFRVYAAHLSEKAVDFRKVDYSGPCALLLGAEKMGVSERALELVDQQVYVPMYGMTESLNVSVACAVILMEARRQREARGMYDHCRLDDTEYNRLMVEWGQASIARFCQARGIAYPVLDDNGDVPPQERERLKRY